MVQCKCPLGKMAVLSTDAGLSIKYDRRIEAILEIITPHLHQALSGLHGNSPSGTG